ncbi:hypothetical protein [Streptomyces sp. F001]|uniref:hypothetical protein n=1 Tax=Streptomyces sp. F001 TaxID=1510026 RepID=UPI001F0DA2E3|nr:hypothetical protein [Streptomyces sp. F001]
MTPLGRLPRIRRRRRVRGRGRQPATDDDYVVQDLIDDEITLDWWTGPDDTGGAPISLYVHDYEACTSTPSADLTPYESQYEGYMGNYGNTLDRWYRRAAVVVWPRERAFAARGEAGPRWALEELQGRIQRGDLDGARTAAESLAPFWKHTDAQPELLEGALHVAAGLGVAETAAMLLEPFRVNALGPQHAHGLAAAVERYGTVWLRQVVGGWFGPRYRYEPHGYKWTERLPDLCTALRSLGRRGQRQRGCCPPGPGSRWTKTCDSGPRPGRPRSAAPTGAAGPAAATPPAGGRPGTAD